MNTEMAAHPKLSEMTAAQLRERVVELTVELDTANKAHRDIMLLASSWDEDGAVGPRKPLSWESVARMAMDYSRFALTKENPKI